MRITLLTVVSVLALTMVACGGGDEAADGGNGGGDGGGGGTPTVSSPAGTYKLDKSDEWRKTVLAALTSGRDDIPAPMLETMKQMVERMDVTVEMKADGTFTVKGQMQAPFEASGTWKLDGTKLTVTTTHTDGREEDPPEVKELVYENGTIRMPKDDEMPFEMVMRKQ